MTTAHFNTTVTREIQRMAAEAAMWHKGETSANRLIPLSDERVAQLEAICKNHPQRRLDPDSWPTLEEQQAYNERDDTLAALEGRLRDREPNGCDDWRFNDE